MVRRSILAVALTLTLTSAVAQAGSWRTYSSKPAGFSLRYPSNWKLSTIPPGTRQISIASPTGTESMTVTVIPVKAGRTAAVTLRRYLAYARSTGGLVASRPRWVKTTFAGRAAEGSVTRPPTEGGVRLAIGQYIIGAGKRTYAVALTVRARRLPRSLGSFPTVYRRIIRSWRFL